MIGWIQASLADRLLADRLVTLRRRPRSAALMRFGYRCAYVALWVWAHVAHPRTRGVKVVVDDGAGHVVFVRHTYGRRSNWELPGGGARRGEAPLDSARREAREELGRDIERWELLATSVGHWHGKSESMACFGARWPGGVVPYDRVEIGAVGWFPLDAPPSPIGPSTREALRALQRA